MVLLYLDPAAGGMLIQTIVAAAVALPFVLRSQISRAVARFRGSGTDPVQTDATTEADHSEPAAR